MKADEKQAVMEGFRSGSLGVLVATTVIEVGVDVPEATVMVVLDADRFGIAQLHQLRGRVGRGKPSEPLRAGRTRRTHRGRREAAGGDGAHHRRLRAGRGRPRAARRGHGDGRAPEGPQRPQAGIAATGPLRGSSTPARWRSIWSASSEGLARHPLLAQEVDVLLAEEDEEFLTKLSCIRGRSRAPVPPRTQRSVPV